MEHQDDKSCSEIEKSSVKRDYKIIPVYRNIIAMVYLHLAALYGFYLCYKDAMYSTILFTQILALVSSVGIQCGAHRLWFHRTYKAKLPLQVLLAIFETMALQSDIYEWSRDHRVHHKYSETDADPHNAKRGFFFAHMGWLLCRKHPDVKEKGKTVDMSDLKNDLIVRFQRRFYIPLVILFWGVLPTLIPYYFWGESILTSYCVCVAYRYVVTLHLTWCVNSAAHLWGTKPYDKTINPVECITRHLMFDECYHNYHHTFPWDYSASEYGALSIYNPCTGIIDMFAKLGWAYDLKKASIILNEMRFVSML